jgi:hypothetical protein
MKRIPKDLKWVERIIWELYEEFKINDEEALSLDLSLRYNEKQLREGEI